MLEMDAKLFRLPTKPNLYYPGAPIDIEKRARVSQLPTPDSRFPGWAAPMEDGRLATDYRPNCAMNIPVGHQFETKEWMQKHADALIDTSRKRMAETSGAVFGLDTSVVPPASIYVSCTESGCEQTVSTDPMAIGIERLGDAAPELFGTFSFHVRSAPAAPAVGLNHRYEGGRNSLRG
jgi:hypothetical protein